MPSDTHRDQIIGLPFWVLFSILLPGFAILYLGLRFVRKVGLEGLSPELTDVQAIVAGIFVGFLYYTLAPAARLKSRFSYYRNSIESLRALISDTTRVGFSLSSPDGTVTVDDAYVFHNEFVCRLKEKGVPILSRDYGYFILASFLAPIFLVYSIIDIVRITVQAVRNTLINGELMIDIVIFVLLVLLSVFLIRDARKSMTIYFRTVCRLIIVNDDVARDTASFITEKGTDFIRPSPGIDYP